MFLILLISLALSLLVGWLVVRFEHVHAWASHDSVASGPQKFHSKPTPRIGGLPVAVGFLAGLSFASLNGTLPGDEGWWFCLAVFPAFFSGLVEDVTKKIGPDIRLWASFLSALLSVYFFDVVIGRVALPGLDALLAWYPLALALSVLAIGGVAHAVNIVDGYNGLAGMVSAMMLLAIATVSWWVGDSALTTIALSLAGGCFGFLVWNWPQGRIFAGDGGAYLLGVSTGMLVVLLIGRNPQVSPWFALLVVSYPVGETLFTIYRRKFVHATASGLPDAKHLHQLIYRRLLVSPGAKMTTTARTRLNSATSPFLWVLAAFSIVPAVILWRDTKWLILWTMCYALLYIWLYRAIVKFAVPRFLKAWGRRAHAWAACSKADPQGRNG